MEDVAAWRRARRAELRARREAISDADRRLWSAAIAANLGRLLGERAPCLLGIYWPIAGEFDAREFAAALLGFGWRLALPVTKKGEALEYRQWTPGAALIAGLWNIPVPRDGAVVAPDIVLAPLVGFDAKKFRLGNGGGYFDRTLALDPRPQAIGVGFEQGRLATIHPQPFDVPMDAIVTEAGIYR